MYTYNAELIRVIDGDTIEANVDLGFYTWKRVTIRLHGIDTPETRTKDLEEKKKGIAAKERLQDLLSDNKFLLVSQGLDKYGRCLGDVIISTGENANLILLYEGHAKEYK